MTNVIVVEVCVYCQGIVDGSPPVCTSCGWTDPPTNHKRLEVTVEDGEDKR